MRVSMMMPPPIAAAAAAAGDAIVLIKHIFTVCAADCQTMSNNLYLLA